MLHRGLKWDLASRGNTYCVHCSIPHSNYVLPIGVLSEGAEATIPAASTYKWTKIPCVWGGIDHRPGNPLLETMPLYILSVIDIAYYISHQFYA